MTSFKQRDKRTTKKTPKSIAITWPCDLCKGRGRLSVFIPPPPPPSRVPSLECYENCYCIFSRPRLFHDISNGLRQPRSQCQKACLLGFFYGLLFFPYDGGEGGGTEIKPKCQIWSGNESETDSGNLRSIKRWHFVLKGLPKRPGVSIWTSD